MNLEQVGAAEFLGSVEAITSIGAGQEAWERVWALHARLWRDWLSDSGQTLAMSVNHPLHEVLLDHAARRIVHVGEGVLALQQIALDQLQEMVSLHRNFGEALNVSQRTED
jgi:hypothetical protein